MQRYKCTSLLGTLHVHHSLYNTGVTIGGIQSGVPILIGGSVTITCTTDFPADSIMLLRDDQPLHEIHQSTKTLMHTILVTDNIHQNTFKCEANFAGSSAFDQVTATIDSKFLLLTLSLVNCKFNTTSQFPNNLLPLASAHLALPLLKLDRCTL